MFFCPCTPCILLVRFKGIFFGWISGLLTQAYLLTYLLRLLCCVVCVHQEACNVWFSLFFFFCFMIDAQIHSFIRGYRSLWSVISTKLAGMLLWRETSLINYLIIPRYSSNGKRWGKCLRFPSLFLGSFQDSGLISWPPPEITRDALELLSVCKTASVSQAAAVTVLTDARLICLWYWGSHGVFLSPLIGCLPDGVTRASSCVMLVPWSGVSHFSQEPNSFCWNMVLTDMIWATAWSLLMDWSLSPGFLSEQSQKINVFKDKMYHGFTLTLPIQI